ncbi:uncharacterized protein K460DRAFT_404436 [Cucurbitaria berberidis CBS 394.84]|uniref:F-box domain-containing protein n=1 Tax=Cucurbitaria berberidis CBS 394.84 TaxID=1168544 RepID=A0A9P4LCI4_9PLEO|nr:uncharacterized protein K460DRAFT_404436 [Cucurbitaria berberidis CBS 394.84]KAF1849199.1 hypothetical protein K460DRAFT_404436 [Cucurbitaria berberidis CBS 394.84]
MEFGHPPPPSTPGPSNGNSIIMESQHTSVPPSPYGPPPSPFASLMAPVAEQPAAATSKTKAKQRARTGAGVKKAPLKKKSNGTSLKLVASGQKAPFRFMDLPGEIRNIVYQHTYANPKQALLVHRPRMASLRSRTRFDRARPLASDVIGNELDSAISGSKATRPIIKPRSKAGLTLRETNRPYSGLTQVCKLLRYEYRPIYMQKQEIGMDLTDIVEYLQAFYYEAPTRFANLPAPGRRETDLPFGGNLTIAIGDKPNEKELAADGIEAFPLLEIWANSFKIEAGFGRYLKVHYAPEDDGEAKDLYRLFGRCVLENRSCSPMNILWRTILRNRALASVRIHRKPAARHVSVFLSTFSPSVKPYIHIIFKKKYAEPWMTKFDSAIPKVPDWLADRGFSDMEYFDVKVGVEPAGVK